MKNNPDYIQYQKELEQELDKKAQIVELLNIYGSCSIREYTPLDISFTNPDILFEIIIHRLEYIREAIEFIDKRTNLGVFVYFAFKALFVGINDLRIDDNFVERKNYFNMILQCYMDHKITPEMIKLVYKLGEKIGEKEKELFPFSLDNLYVYFIYVLLRINQATITDLNVYLMRMLEKFHIVDLHFQDSDLKNIPHENIINNLFNIFFVDKIDNNFHLYIKNGELKAVPFTIEELNEYINSPDLPKITKVNEDKNAKKKKKKNKKSKGKKKESQKDEGNDKKEEIKSQVNIHNEKKEDIINIQIQNNAKRDEKGIQCLIEKKIEDKGEQFLIVMQEIEELKDYTKACEKRIRELEGYKEENEEKIEDLEELVNDLQKNEEETALKTKKKYRKIKKLNILNEKQNKLIISIQKKCQENSEEIIKIKSDIKLIKLYRVFKEFVNYIYNGLNLQGDFYYEDKIKKIIEFLDNLTSDEYDKELVQSIKAFMNELNNKIDLGNNTALNIDFSISMFDQLFEFIDKQKKHEDFKNWLKFESIAESDIINLILNIENNYKTNNEKDIKVVLKKVNIPNLCKLWIKK